jgi:hypothetical protein
MKKNDIIPIVKYSLFAAIIIGWLYDFYLFQKYDRFHTPNLRALPLIDIKIVRGQLLMSTVLLIGYFVLDKIKPSLILLSIYAFILLLYIQNVLILSHFPFFIYSSGGIDYRISDFIKIIIISLSIVYSMLRTRAMQ